MYNNNNARQAHDVYNMNYCSATFSMEFDRFIHWLIRLFQIDHIYTLFLLSSGGLFDYSTSRIQIFCLNFNRKTRQNTNFMQCKWKWTFIVASWSLRPTVVIYIKSVEYCILPPVLNQLIIYKIQHRTYTLLDVKWTLLNLHKVWKLTIRIISVLRRQFFVTKC